MVEPASRQEQSRRRASAVGVVCRIVVLLTATLSVPSAFQQRSDEFLLAPGRAGRIEAGTSVDEIYQMFGRSNVSLVAEFPEGMFQPVLQIALPGASVKPAISIPIREWPCGEFSPWGINVLDRRFRTSDGFGVGSLAGDLRRAHPFEITEEEGAHAAIVADLAMTFFLTRQGPVDRQTVSSVWIPLDPEAVAKKRCPDRAATLFSADDAGIPPQANPARDRLDARIPAAIVEKYKNIHDAKDWRNPYLTMRAEGIEVVSHELSRGPRTVPAANLAAALIDLPVAAWPYGRVVMASDIGLRRPNGEEDAAIGHNHEAADRILKALGITVVWVPSA